MEYINDKSEKKTNVDGASYILGSFCDNFMNESKAGSTTR